ncbi:hypothetical protein [Peptoniphilus porci]|uniref:hypothetical protein n=1 Tax=Peptoniphilus porci TaxID=2652280 RepID=UPI0015BDEB7C|nr:hypothetical protein [Peptoniphilus porci]
MEKIFVIILNVIIFGLMSILLSRIGREGSLLLKLIYSIILVMAGFNIANKIE